MRFGRREQYFEFLRTKLSITRKSGYEEFCFLPRRVWLVHCPINSAKLYLCEISFVINGHDGTVHVTDAASVCERINPFM